MAQEKPILFSAPMVRAILEGRKTQTRRIVKPPAGLQEPVNLAEHGCGSYTGKFNDPDSWGYPFAEDGNDMPLSWWCSLNPYGQPGDRLWVRETFRQFSSCDECGCSEAPCCCPEDGALIYKADEQGVNPNYKRQPEDPKWTPSIHMPRAFSRIDLLIKDIRVERLQDISRGEAMSEGCPFPNMADGEESPKEWFKDLWININGDASWDANPWVWVVEFERIETS